MSSTEAYSTRALRVAKTVLAHSKDADVAVSEVIAYMVGIYGNRKYMDGFNDAMKLKERTDESEGRE